METMTFDADLFTDLCGDASEYVRLGYTTCGAADMAVIVLSDRFRAAHPALSYRVVRVKERFVNQWESSTFLEFSDVDVTADERELSADVDETDAGEEPDTCLNPIDKHWYVVTYGRARWEIHAPDCDTCRAGAVPA